MSTTLFLRLTPLLILPCLFGCAEDELQTDDTLPSAGLPDNVRARLSYDFETLSWREITGVGANPDLAFLDNIASEPTADRQALSIDFANDGQLTITAEKRTPIHSDLPSRFDAGVPLSDDIPQLYRMVLTDGRYDYYDRNGRLINSHANDDEVLDPTYLQKLLGAYDWAAAAARDGATVTSIDENTIKIIRRIKLPPAPGGGGNKSVDEIIAEDIILKDLNIQLGGTIRDDRGELLSRMAIQHQYLADQQRWVPEFSHYEEFLTDPVTQAKYTAITTAYYDGYTFITQ